MLIVLLAKGGIWPAFMCYIFWILRRRRPYLFNRMDYPAVCQLIVNSEVDIPCPPYHVLPLILLYGLFCGYYSTTFRLHSRCFSYLPPPSSNAIVDMMNAFFLMMINRYKPRNQCLFYFTVYFIAECSQLCRITHRVWNSK